MIERNLPCGCVPPRCTGHEALTQGNVTFERIVTMRPAFHRVHADPSKNYGVHGVELRMVLRGPLGATQFLLYTGWMLDKTLDWWAAKGITADFKPCPADRGYHWSAPRYEGQQQRECELLPGGKCYYDGSGLNAEITYKALVEKGDAGVWADLEEFYHDLCKRTEEA